MTLFRIIALFLLMVPTCGRAATLIASNLWDVYDIRYWGADPTGVTNASQALSNAIAALKPVRIHISKGTYRVNQMWINDSFVTLYGDGPGASTFISSNTAPMFYITGSDPVVEDLNLQGYGIATHGFYQTNSEQAIFRNVVIDNVTSSGFHIQTNSFDSLYDRCRVVNCGTGMRFVAGFEGSRILNTLVYFNTNYQINLGTIGLPRPNFTIRDSKLESDKANTTNLLVNDVSSLVLDGVYFETVAITSKDIVVDGVTSLMDINGIYSNGGGVSTNSIYIVGSSNIVSINNSYIWNYVGFPISSSPRLSIRSCNLNETYYPMFLGSEPVSFKVSPSLTNAWVEGRIFMDSITATTNHTGTDNFTNLFTLTVPGNTLTNVGDEVEFYLSGQFRFATATTNDFRCIYGTSTLFDTGFITASNCPWKVKIRITRTGNSSQLVEAEVLWMAPAAGLFGNGAVTTYATNMPLAQVNGITNIFAFQGKSRIPAAITNNYRLVRWNPGTR